MGALSELLHLPYPDTVVALGAAVLGLVAGVVGVLAVLRRRSLVADALAHSTLPGVAVAFLVTGAKDAGSLLVGAALAALVGAVLMVGIERTGRLRPDAAIGVVLSGAFALGVVLITHVGSTGQADQAGLENYLFGQAAGLLARDVAVFAALGVVALGAVVLAFRMLKASLFDPAFAGAAGLRVPLVELWMTALLVVAVIVGVRTVGAILMVAMIVVPAVAARQLTRRLSTMLLLAGVIGAAIGVSGALASSALAVPTGPVIVLLGVSVVVCALLAAPGRGVLWRRRVLRRDRLRALSEGLLVDLAEPREGAESPGGAEPLEGTEFLEGTDAGPVRSVRHLARAGGRSPATLRRVLRRLRARGLVRVAAGGVVVLTPAGLAAAREARDRRRLWSAWLEHGWRLELPDAREPDPTDLRASLGDEAADRLAALAEVGNGAATGVADGVADRVTSGSAGARREGGRC